MSGLEELLANATPGPWESRERDYRVLTNVGEAYPAGRGRFGSWEDAQLAARAPDLARLCLDMGEALRGSVDGHWHDAFCPEVIGDGDCSCSVATYKVLLARLDGIGNTT
jgi:hypothetical protein